MMMMIGDNMSKYTDIKTSHLPDDVVNHEFLLCVSNQNEDPAKRTGKSAVWWADATFHEHGGVKEMDDWESDIDDLSADELEYMARLLGHQAQRLANWAQERRDEEVQSGSNSEG